MKIAFFTDTYLPNKDGVVSSIVSTRLALEAMGHEVYIFASGSRKDKKENKDPRVHYFASTAFRPYPDYKIALFPFLASGKLRRYGIDVIHTHGIATMGLASLQASVRNGLPVIGTFHTMLPDATHYLSKNKLVDSMAKGMIWRYLKWFFNRCDLAIAPTGTIQSIMVEHGIKRVEVAPSGIDLRKFPVTDTEHDGEIGLYLGRMALEKNLGIVIGSLPHILKSHPDFRLVLAGKGPELDFYKKLVAQKNLQKYVTFLGYIKDGELAGTYGMCDVFVIPSKFETQGLSALEAMACGKPVVASRELALGEIVKDGYNGFLCGGNDEKEFAEKVIKALENRAALTVGARKTAERFAVDKCAANLVRIYEKAIDGKKEKLAARKKRK